MSTDHGPGTQPQEAPVAALGCGPHKEATSLILLESSSTHCRHLVRDLRGHYRRVVTVRDMKTAFAAILEDSFEVLLLHWRGAYADVSLCEALRNDRPSVAIIAALGPRLRDGYAGAFEAGVHDCVATPVNAAEVCARVANLRLRRDTLMLKNGPVEPPPESASKLGKQEPRNADARQAAAGSPGFALPKVSRGRSAEIGTDTDGSDWNPPQSVMPGPKAIVLGRDEVSSRVGGPRGSVRSVAAELVIDLGTSRVWVDGSEVELTMRSWQLLIYLVRRRGQIVSVAELGREAFDETLNESTLRDHVQRLRTAIGKAAPLIKTRRGRGYLLE